MPEINFFWDPLSDNILQERDETGAVTAEYTAEPGLYGNIISQNRNGVESQFHYDAQSSTLAVTDDNQNVTDTFAYTAFGEVTERTGTTEVPFQYIGQKGYHRDSVIGQTFVRQRRYGPAIIRWMSIDPVPARHEVNLYRYVANSPTVGTDPSGLQYPFEKPHPDITAKFPETHCKGCGHYNIQWEVAPSTVDTLFFVQRICFITQIHVCADQCGCVEVEKVSETCCIYEYLKAASRASKLTDEWSATGAPQIGPCLSRGVVGNWSFIWGISDPAIATWEGWKNPDIEPLTCAGAKLNVGKYSLVEPPLLARGHPAVKEFGQSNAILEYNCCPKPDRGVHSILYYWSTSYRGPPPESKPSSPMELQCK